MMKMSRTSLAFLLFGYAFLYIPIVFVIFGSFSDSVVSGVWTKFSLRWFYEVFGDEDLMGAALTSLEVAGISATCSAILGTIAASVTAGIRRSRGTEFIKNTIVVPMVVSEIIIGFSLFMLFVAVKDVVHLSSGLTTIVIGHTVLAIGYAYMIIRNGFLSLDSSLAEAAMSLGAGSLTVFLRIKLPIISKAILSGWLLAFTMSLDDVVIASFLGGPGSTTLPILIFSNVRLGISPAINAISTIFLVVVLVLVFATYFVVGMFKDKTRSSFI